MRIALLQLQCNDLEQAEEGLLHALEMVDEVGRRGADLIVLPETTYPAYYLRGLREYQEAPLRPWSELVALFGEKARQYRTHIAAGIVQPGEAGELPRNAAVLWGPDGKVIGTTAKSFLWHFDRCWFAGGTMYPVFDTALGRIGLMVCADGRMPEIARVMALKGAQLIVDVTALVSGGGDRATLSNPQLEYMLPARAMENGVWLLVANKVGLEASSVLYCGGSCVIGPDGKKRAQASPDREEIVECEIELAGGPALPAARQPHAYTLIAAPTDTLPIAHILKEAVVPEETVVRYAAVQIHAGRSMEAYLQRAAELVDTAVRQDASLVVLPGELPAEAVENPEKAALFQARLAEISAQVGCGLAGVVEEFAGGVRYRTAVLWDKGELVGKYRKVHTDGSGYAAGESLPVFPTRFGRLGFMLDEEALLPEVPRCLMLGGADVVIWQAGRTDLPLRLLARARADESKVYLALGAAFGQGTALVNPAGAFLAAALPDVEQVIAGQVAWVTARYKEMAPSTHVVWGRRPETYKELIR